MTPLRQWGWLAVLCVLGSPGAAAESEPPLIPIGTVVDAKEVPVSRMTAAGTWFGIVPGTSKLIVARIPRHGTEVMMAVANTHGHGSVATAYAAALQVVLAGSDELIEH